MSHNLPPLVSLRAFEAAARHASFKRAAEELCVTPSSVSHHIQKLEDWLGVKLFQRLNRRVALTVEGRTYFFTLSKAFEEISTVTDLVSQRKRQTPSKPKLKIIANAGFIECWLGPRLAGLQALMPDVQLDIAFGNDIDDYLKGGADVAVHFGRGDWPEFQSEFLRTGWEFPVCSPQILHSQERLQTPADLVRFTLLHEDNTAGWSNWLRQARVRHPALLDGPILHSTSTIFDKVMACEGVGLGDDIIAADLLFSGRLVKPLKPVRESDQSLYFLCMQKSKNHNLTNLFRDWLIEELKLHEAKTVSLRESRPFITH